MASVWGELKRRNVVKVAAAYAVVGWLIVEIASTVFPILQIPDWAIALITMLLILCFPVALILSWAYELTPEGMRRSNQVPATESITRITGRKLDFVIIGLLVLAVGFMFVDNYLPESGPSAVEIDPASLEPEIDDSPATGESVSEEREVLPNSVAVLPLENLSPDPDNAYFAAGMHEAILNELAKISAMNVIARTSMLQYADRTTPIADIARDLNVETIMEGSVQYANDRVLVTAQLIDPETNAHLWSESYNREFADVFAIQDDIAGNIANALEAEFSPTEQANIEKRPTDSLEAYALYLRALSAPTIQAAEPLIDRAIGLDSEFALAYAW